MQDIAADVEKILTDARDLVLKSIREGREREKVQEVKDKRSEELSGELTEEGNGDTVDGGTDIPVGDGGAADGVGVQKVVLEGVGTRER
jgi:hypothetical protein